MVDSKMLAKELYTAAQTAKPIALLTDRIPDLDWEQARQVALATDVLRREAGEIQIGWKLGWTSAAMREALGVNRPNWGTLWRSQVIANGDRLQLTSFIHPKVEPELVWRCPVDVGGPTVTAADIAEIGGQWALGLEVVDPRFPSFQFDALDNTADNSSSAAIVIGDFTPSSNLADDAVTVATLAVTFSNGYDLRHGFGSNAMESPLEAVAWFVRALAKENMALQAGDIVFTGGLTAPFDVATTTTYQLEGPPLPAVSLVAG